MSWDSILFWILAVVATQLNSVSLLAHALALVWVFIIALITLVFSLDLDLLASALLAVYSSVFLFLTLLSVHVTAYWAPASHTSTQPGAGFWLCVFGVLALSSARGLPTFEALPFLTTWSDFNLAASQVGAQAVGIVHWAFYRLFIWETLAANLYILLALALATALVVALRRGAQSPAWRQGSLLSRQLPTRLQSAAPRIRLVAQFRRQTRRKNSSTLRTTL